MFNLERTSSKVAFKISDALKLDNDKREVLSYGAFALAHTILSIALVAILGSVSKVTFGALLVSIAVAILRKYSGGVHASSSTICTILGTVITVVLAILVKFILGNISGTIIIIFELIIFIFAYYVIFKLAPVDSMAKPIKTESKRRKMKKVSIKVLNIYLLISIIIMGYQQFLTKDVVSNYSLYICIGAGWQSFTLTKIGHAIVVKLDAFFNSILNFQEVK